MIRCAVSATRNIWPLLKPCHNAAKIINLSSQNYCSLLYKNVHNPSPKMPICGKVFITMNTQILDIANNLKAPARSVTKFSLKRGKRKTVKAVIGRFFRLHWGGWIRTKAGRQKKMWKKSGAQKRRLKQHVFCNATQNTLLDKMVTKFWKKPKYYVDDPYASYHTREEFFTTRKNPVDK